MNTRKWVSLFFSTLLLGGLAGVLIGLFTDFKMLFTHGMIGFFIALIQLFSIGLLYSVWSQMFFYAYLMIHRLGLGMFNSVQLWNKVQIVLIFFVFFDLVFFRSIHTQTPVWDFFILPIILFIASLPVAYIKQKETNRMAFIPTVFFMFVVTAIELMPAFESHSVPSLIRMLIPLLVCNAWQVLRLHRLIEQKEVRSS